MAATAVRSAFLSTLRWGTALPLASALLWAPALSGQNLPPADEIIARYVTAIGGREANLALSSVRQEGTMALPGLGIQGTFSALRMLPDRSFLAMTIPGIAEQSTGFDGALGWSYSNLTGPMILEDEMLEDLKEGASALAIVYDASLVPDRETLELTVVGGEPCFRVRQKWVSGRETLDCFSSESGLLLASEGVQPSPMGDVPVTTLYYDYQEYSGIRMAARTVLQTLGQEQVVTFTRVVLNDVDPSELAPPPAVRALAEPVAR